MHAQIMYNRTVTNILDYFTQHDLQGTKNLKLLDPDLLKAGSTSTADDE